MSNEQFIQWLLGFCAAVEETPTQKQWEHIKKVLSDMNCNPVSIKTNHTDYNNLFRKIEDQNPPTKYQWPDTQPPSMLYNNSDKNNNTV